MRAKRPAQAMVEIALALPLLILLLVGMTDLVFLVRDATYVQAAVREAARASVERQDYTAAAQAAADTYRRTLASSRLDPQRARSEPLALSGRWGDGTVTFRGSYDAKVLLPIPFLPNTLTVRHAESAAVITFVERR